MDTATRATNLLAALLRAVAAVVKAWPYLRPWVEALGGWLADAGAVVHNVADDIVRTIADLVASM